MVLAVSALSPAAEVTAGDRVNVLFLMTDQHHADWLGCAGNPVVKTPNLDRLAAGGTRFSRMFVPVPYCSPTRAAIVTGLYPGSLGLGRNINPKQDPLRLREPVQTYLHQLAALGYHCHQLGKWHLGDPAELSCFPGDDAQVVSQLVNERRRAAGAGYYDDGPRPGEVELYRDVYMRGEISVAHRQWLQQGKIPEQDVGLIGRSRVKAEYQYEAVLADYCIELLKRHRNEPFAITYSVSPPHALWVAPSPFYDLYDPAKLPLPATWTNGPAAWTDAASARMGRIYGEAGFREYLRCYAAQITMVDAAIGRILAALDELKLAGRTLVIFTSDHGNMLGQHGMMDKTHGAFYDDLLRVPLLLRLPGRIDAGRVSDRFATALDLAPTVLDYLGAQPLAKAHGRSLRGVMAGTVPDLPAVFGERGEPGSKAVARMVRTRQWKLCLLPRGARELYQLEQDPGETVNVVGDPANSGVLQALVAQLREHMQAVGDQADFNKVIGR